MNRVMRATVCFATRSNATAEMRRIRDTFKATDAWAEDFVCLDCRTKWNACHFCGYIEPERVSCSNCYSDNIAVTRVRLEFDGPDATEQLKRGATKQQQVCL